MGLYTSIKVLVVDDFATMRRIVKGALKQLGFSEIIEAEDGKIALDELKKEKIGLIVSDWNMPNMTGLDLLRAVKSDDGLKKGEFSPVFYLKDRFVVTNQGTFWLSEFSQEPGRKGWDAVCPRIVTWGRFHDLSSDQDFFVFNTHFDHVGKKARIASARLVMEKVRSFAGDSRVILTGDFNATVQDSAYLELTVDRESGPFFTDTYSFPGVHRYGATQTYNGFRHDIRPGHRIDYIFVRKIKKVYAVGILPPVWDDSFVSDHNAVLARIRICP